MLTDRQAVLEHEGLQALLDSLSGQGYRLVGPTVRDGAIVYDDIASLGDLPRGIGDEQEGGHYRLTDRGDAALFGYAVGPQSFKRFLHPPMLKLWTAKRDGDEVRIEPEPQPDERIAFIGARACELRAIAIQDRVFLGGAHVDRDYRARREGAFIVAVNCGQAAATCFCTSMDAGPKVTSGHDLALTEIVSGSGFAYLAEAGSEAGAALLSGLPQRPAEPTDVAAADAVVARTASSMQRAMPETDLRDLLMRNLEHPRWDEVAGRCLTCGNCTMVCPTCFCTTVEDASDLAGIESSRSRRWDSCFTGDHSYMHGGSVRNSARSRYRQWMTHKLATWFDQFGSSGCVGCGRCIAWCPVGIDITEETGAIFDSDPGRGAEHAD